MKKYLFLAYPLALYLLLVVPALLFSAPFRAHWHTSPAVLQSFCSIVICVIYGYGRRRKDNIPGRIPWGPALGWGLAGLAVQAAVWLGFCGKVLVTVSWKYYLSESLWSYFWIAVSEELLFREYLITRLRRLHTPLWAILLASSVIFSVSHGEQTLFLFVQRAVMGVGFGWMYYRWNNLTICIATHWVFNAMLSVMQPQQGAIESVYGVPHFGITLLLSLTALLGIIVAYWINKSKFAV